MILTPLDATLSTDRRCVPIGAHAIWDRSDPTVVVLVIHSGGEGDEDVPWRLSRRDLADVVLDAGTWLGHEVTAALVCGDVVMELRPATVDPPATIVVAADALRWLLLRSHRVVPIGAEVVDWDLVLDQILTAGGGS